MSNKLKEAVRRMASNGNIIFTGTVQEVDLVQSTCTVSPSDGGPPFFEVLMKAHPDAKLFTVPLVGSEVVCARLTEQNVVIIAVGSPDTYMLETEGVTLSLSDVAAKMIVGQSSIIIEAGLIEIKGASTTLKAVIQDLINAVLALAPISAAPGAPSVPNPVDITKLNLITTALNTLLK